MTPGSHGSTFGGNPLAIAAANAVLARYWSWATKRLGVAVSTDGSVVGVGPDAR